MPTNLDIFPPARNLETVPVLKKAALAHRYLAELKGISRSIPNQAVLINTLSLQEAKDSSAIENIITTHDELFKEELFPEFASNASAKEVRNSVTALKRGFELVKKDFLLTNKHILAIQEELEKNKAGFRKLPGTELKNYQTGALCAKVVAASINKEGPAVVQQIGLWRTAGSYLAHKSANSKIRRFL